MLVTRIRFEQFRHVLSRILNAVDIPFRDGDADERRNERLWHRERRYGRVAAIADEVVLVEQDVVFDDQKRHRVVVRNSAKPVSNTGATRFRMSAVGSAKLNTGAALVTARSGKRL